MLKQLLGGAILATALALPAQSPLTTLYAGGNGLGGNTAVYFDLTVNAPLTINQLDVNALGGTGASVLEFWTVPTTWVGNDTNAAAWTLMGSTASVTASAQGTPTVAPITSPFVLTPGTYGVAITYVGTLGPAYTNGTGANQTYSTAEMTLQAGASGGIFTGAINNPRVWNGSIYYSVSGSGTVATRTNYGAGCVSRQSSVYENFASSAQFDLSNSSLSMLNTGNGYLVLPGTTTYVAPSATAQVLALGDDTEAAVTLSGSFNYPGGSTGSLTVCSNGYVSVASGNGTAWTPVVATFLNASQTGWWSWHDYSPNLVGSGQIKFEEVNGIAYITWDDVWDFGAAAGPGSTSQMQFDLATGNVHMLWQNMSAAGNGRLVGYSPGGASVDPGNRDISATLPSTFTLGAADVLPLALTTSARPLAGTSLNFNTSNISATAPFGAITLGFTNPALDLTPLGMATCSQYTDNLVTLLFLPLGSSTNATAFNVPNAIGLHILAQAFVYDPAAGLTALGAVSSNGVDLGIGNL